MSCHTSGKRSAVQVASHGSRVHDDSTAFHNVTITTAQQTGLACLNMAHVLEMRPSSGPKEVSRQGTRIATPLRDVASLLFYWKRNEHDLHLVPRPSMGVYVCILWH